ncbi:MAG: aminotransferase class V-fold PLP-dependent enzyme [Pseudomonadota bacterium]
MTVTAARVYLDHNATTPLCQPARDAMVAAMDCAGNPSSIHAEGRAARAMVEESREHVAHMIGCRARDVMWTSGATEANNWLLAATLSRGAKLLVSAVEHESVLAPAVASGAAVIPVDGDGIVDPEALDEMLAASGPGTLVSVMAANNETGAIQPLDDIAAVVQGAGALLHVDAVQYAGKRDLHPVSALADYLTLSAHKFGGPKGIGALVLCNPEAPEITALMTGGGQERRKRAGTENVLGAVGFGVAAKMAVDRLADMPRQKDLRDGL